jgi:hypothetical protein
VPLQSIHCYLRRHLFELIRIRDDLVRGQSSAWYGARMFEFRSDAGTVARLAATCATYDEGSIRAAIDAAIELHALLAREVFDRLRLAYPTEAEARLRAMIAQAYR